MSQRPIPSIPSLKKTAANVLDEKEGLYPMDSDTVNWLSPQSRRGTGGGGTRHMTDEDRKLLGPFDEDLNFPSASSTSMRSKKFPNKNNNYIDDYPDNKEGGKDTDDLEYLSSLTKFVPPYFGSGLEKGGGASSGGKIDSTGGMGDDDEHHRRNDADKDVQHMVKWLSSSVAAVNASNPYHPQASLMELSKSKAECLQLKKRPKKTPEEELGEFQEIIMKKGGIATTTSSDPRSTQTAMFDWNNLPSQHSTPETTTTTGFTKLGLMDRHDVSNYHPPYDPEMITFVKILGRAETDRVLEEEVRQNLSAGGPSSGGPAESSSAAVSWLTNLKNKNRQFVQQKERKKREEEDQESGAQERLVAPKGARQITRFGEPVSLFSKESEILYEKQVKSQLFPEHVHDEEFISPKIPIEQCEEQLMSLQWLNKYTVPRGSATHLQSSQGGENPIVSSSTTAAAPWVRVGAAKLSNKRPFVEEPVVSTRDFMVFPQMELSTVPSSYHHASHLFASKAFEAPIEPTLKRSPPKKRSTTVGSLDTEAMDAWMQEKTSVVNGARYVPASSSMTTTDLHLAGFEAAQREGDFQGGIASTSVFQHDVSNVGPADESSSFFHPTSSYFSSGRRQEDFIPLAHVYTTDQCPQVQKPGTAPRPLV